jgi:hypothetical protein
VIGATIDSSVYIRDISDTILDETMRVLRDKFEWSGGYAARFAWQVG